VYKIAVQNRCKKYPVYLGTAPWEINFAYFLVNRTTFYGLSDVSHKKIQKCIEKLKFEAKVQNFEFFALFQLQLVFIGYSQYPVSISYSTVNYIQLGKV